MYYRAATYSSDIDAIAIPGKIICEKCTYENIIFVNNSNDILLTQCRLHEKDIYGYVIGEDDCDWSLLQLPLLYEANKNEK